MSNYPCLWLFPLDEANPYLWVEFVPLLDFLMAGIIQNSIEIIGWMPHDGHRRRWKIFVASNMHTWKTYPVLILEPTCKNGVFHKFHTIIVDKFWDNPLEHIVPIGSYAFLFFQIFIFVFLRVPIIILVRNVLLGVPLGGICSVDLWAIFGLSWTLQLQLQLQM